MKNFFQDNRPIQVVCLLDDLKAIFEEGREEQKVLELQQAQQQEKEEYLTTEEVCEKLQVTKPTLWRWAKMRYLVQKKVGHKNYYLLSDIKELRKG